MNENCVEDPFHTLAYRIGLYDLYIQGSRRMLKHFVRNTSTGESGIHYSHTKSEHGVGGTK